MMNYRNGLYVVWLCWLLISASSVIAAPTVMTGTQDPTISVQGNVQPMPALTLKVTPGSGMHKTYVTFKATVTMGDKPVQNKVVQFKVGNMVVCQVITDTYGVAKYVYKISLSLHTGKTKIIAMSDTLIAETHLEVIQTPTKLWVNATFPGSTMTTSEGKTIILKARLGHAGTMYTDKGNGISSQNVQFTASGAKIANCTTDSDGFCTAPWVIPKGTVTQYTLSGYYDGSNAYAAAKDETPTTFTVTHKPLLPPANITMPQIHFEGIY